MLYSMKNILLIPGLTFLLIACSYKDVVIIGPITDEIDDGKVIVYYDQLPQCDINTVAYIRVPGDFLSRRSLIKTFKHEASKLGATGIQIIDIQKSGAAGYFGSARAIRCASS
jgi:hypothetical protein